VLDPTLAVNSLRRCALFAHVDDEGLQALAGRMRRRRFRRNEVVFHRGDVGDSLQVVVSGGVKIVLPSEEGDEAIIATLWPGDAFGEMAFLLEQPRAFDVDAATDDTRILSLSEGALRTMIAEDAALAAKVLLNLSKLLCVKLIRAS